MTTDMMKSLVFFALLLCQQAILASRRDPTIDDWPSWLLVDPETPRINQEDEPQQPRRIRPKSVFIAPAFPGSSPDLPDCAEGYKADSMGRCVKLVQLNHAAQLNFLLQRLNAMYSTIPEKDPSHDLAPSDSNSEPLHFTLPLDIPVEPEEETKESVEVSVVMADVLKGDTKKPEDEKPETIVAVWKTGKNGTELEELETASDLEMQAANVQLETSNMTAPVDDITKYDIVNENSNSTVDKRTPTLDIVKPSSEKDSEPSKGLDSAMDLLEEVSDFVSEKARFGNISRRNPSSSRIIFPNSTEEKSVVKKILSVPEYIKATNTTPEVEVQKTSESVNELLLLEQPDTSFIRFPNDNDGNIAGDSSYNTMDDDYGGGIELPPTDYDEVIHATEFQQRPAFWWLPPGWRLDPSRHQPMLVRFWARMPLIQEPVYQSHNLGVNRYSNVHRRQNPMLG